MSKIAKSVSLDDTDWILLREFGVGYGVGASAAIGIILRKPQEFAEWMVRATATSESKTI